MDLTANVLLAVGALPLMTSYVDEMVEAVSKCDALSVNIGCLDKVQLEAMTTAVLAARRFGKPWVLDPVGYGFTKERTEACRRLVELNPPSIIRGNHRELTDESVCKQLASRLGCVVAMTGEKDYVTDGLQERWIAGGDVMMDRVTAMGCSLSALCAAFAAKNHNYLQAASDALTLYADMGALAAAKSTGTASFRTVFVDELYNHGNLDSKDCGSFNECSTMANNNNQSL